MLHVSCCTFVLLLLWGKGPLRNPSVVFWSFFLPIRSPSNLFTKRPPNPGFLWHPPFHENQRVFAKAYSCEPSRELQESLGPYEPEIPKKSEKSLEKVSKKSRTDIFETFSRLFGLFRDFF